MESRSPRQALESSPFIIARKPLPGSHKLAGPDAESTIKAVEPSNELSHGLAKKRRRGLGWCFEVLNYVWVVEITSLVVASAALAAIIILLAVHQDRPLPQWPRLISINSLIAIFTAILKAAIILPVAEGMYVQSPSESQFH